MAEEVALRSENGSLESLRQTLNSITGAESDEDLAILLLMATTLYSDAQCRCEEAEASYGGESEEARSCEVNVGKSRDELLETYTGLVGKLRK